MERQEVLARVITVTERVLEPRLTPTETTSFVNDLDADSLTTVELIMELEDEFTITIPDGDDVRITTVGKATDYITWVLNGSQGENPLDVAEAQPGSGALGSPPMFKGGVGL